MNKKGVALFFVLAILLVVAILANISLNFILSHSRFTTHQIRRIQAYYAAQAGVNYAREQLRLNNAAWSTTTAPADFRTFKICGGPYSAAYPTSCNGDNITEASFPSSISYVGITIGPLNATNSRAINATANFTYDG